MKILDKFILKIYLGAFFKSFIAFLMVLALQFISRYREEIFGKGLETVVILKIFAYASVSLVVLTLPVSVLMSSLVSLGTMGEQYELAAMRSAGVSLYRILRTMFVATFGITLLSFYLSTYLLPVANLKLYSLLFDVKQVKPTFNLHEGHFYGGIDGYTIRIEGKNHEREMLYNISIYDHTKQQGDERVVMADSGQLIFNAEAFYMKMILFHGVGHQALRDDPMHPKYPYNRFYFDTLMYKFDLSKFGLQRTPEEAFATHHYMLNLGELSWSIDSVRKGVKKENQIFKQVVKSFVRLDSNIAEYQLADTLPRLVGGMLFQYPEELRLDILGRSMGASRKVQERAREEAKKYEKEARQLRDYQIEYHLKFALPAACLLFLFIGAPLGSIVRRGGIGFPIVFSSIVFLLFYVTLMQGKKMAGEAVISPWTGAWLPILVLSPLALLFVTQSSADSKLLDRHIWYKRIRNLKWLFNLVNPVAWLRKIPFIDDLFISAGNALRRLIPFRRRRRRLRPDQDDPSNSRSTGDFDRPDW